MAGDQETLRFHIRRTVQEDTFRRLPVTAGPARLLVVVLNAAGHIIMYDKSHVGFVDSHTEGVGRDHDPGLIIYKAVLAFFSFQDAQSRVVTGNRNPFRGQKAVKGIHIFAGGTVNNAAVIFMFRQVFLNIAILVLRLLYAEIQVGPVKSRHMHIRIPQPQIPFDILPDPGRRGRGKGRQDRTSLQHPDEHGNPPVAGTEILSPLGNTMGFIHSNEPDIRFGSQADCFLRIQPLRRKVEKFVRSADTAADDLPDLRMVQCTVDICRRDAILPQSLDLVFHQRDQGRDHDRKALREQGRDLVADGFPGAGGHDGQHVPARHNVIDDLFLSGPEAVISEPVF